MKSWKYYERKVAEYFGGQRVGNTGKSTTDCTAGDWLNIEVKTRKKVSSFIMDAMRQAHKHCGPNQLGIVLLHQDGGRIDDDLVIMRARDFRDWIGENRR